MRHFQNFGYQNSSQQQFFSHSDGLFITSRSTNRNDKFVEGRGQKNIPRSKMFLCRIYFFFSSSVNIMRHFQSFGYQNSSQQQFSSHSDGQNNNYLSPPHEVVPTTDHRQQQQQHQKQQLSKRERTISAQQQPQQNNIPTMPPFQINKKQKQVHQNQNVDNNIHENLNHDLPSSEHHQNAHHHHHQNYHHQQERENVSAQQPRSEEIQQQKFQNNTGDHERVINFLFVCFHFTVGGKPPKWMF
jgi:hypothetical protein